MAVQFLGTVISVINSDQHRLLPVSEGDVFGFALPARGDLGGLRLRGLLLRRGVLDRSWSGNGRCEQNQQEGASVPGPWR
ncbi:hypothetical protein HAP41_0000035310 [Bradyrhizobium barranii subsp. apii]|uniref:Uncharacterized protein n=1 Tax=Bradyrhizobium barranii subsp. apii TaxID=2819348 RepID=A0A8T5VA45_9BRAD|nr:hypothetical protein [Bradyrhizobium barranii]UPT85539.1 hypothetical protein HAP41_0000035310 [Bradyrhizobium barranii subsp. apii]UPT98704.1 hypothetical protein J4G48_0011890 [Bradyrhizobium barranii subsp. apii]